MPEPVTEIRGGYIARIAPGLAVCAGIGAVAYLLDARVLPDDLFIVNYVILAIVLGLVVRSTVGLPEHLEPGVKFAGSTCLYAGIVLMGAGLNLGLVISIGAQALVMVAGSITMSIVICGWLGARTGAGERLGHLVGTGIGVCGVSAVIALAPAIRASRREVVTAIGAALLTDVMVLVGLPVLGHGLGWGDRLVGFLAGVVPSNTAQCVAIGHAYSEGAGIVATVVKSARNSLMPVVVLVITYIYTRRGLPVGEKPGLRLLWSRFPRFILGFLLLAGLRTIGVIPDEIALVMRQSSTWLFVICFAAIGLGINVREFGRHDAVVLSFGFLMTIIIGTYGYLYLTRFLGY